MIKKIIALSFLWTVAANPLRAQIINADPASSGGNYEIANYPGNFTGYYDGFSIVFRANHSNPGPSATMKVGTASTTTIVNTAGTALAVNDIRQYQVVTLVYDVANTRFQMITTSGNVSAGSGFTGTGTAGRVAFYTSSTTLGNSILMDDGTNIGVGVVPNASYKLLVNGKLSSTGINETSDLRYKKNIFTIEDPLQKVLALRGVNYLWRTSEFKEKNFDTTAQVGLIAQEVEKIIPQVVHTDASGFKSVEYSKLVALLIEAIKEQQKKIDSLQLAVGNLQNENQALRAEREKEIQTLKADVKNLHDAVNSLLNENALLKTTGQK